MDDRLAIRGGPAIIPAGTFGPWPPLNEVDERYVVRSLRAKNLTCGPHNLAFERDFAAWNGNLHAVLTNSAVAALHMCIAGSGCHAGDEVIVPAYAWSSAAIATLLHNCVPVFVDVDWQTMNIDTDKIESSITERTRAIIVSHLHGLPADMERVKAIAAAHALTVVEDAGHALGALFKGRRTGTLGDCAAFSLTEGRTLCAGVGGVFVTDDHAILRRAKRLWATEHLSSDISAPVASIPSEQPPDGAEALYRTNDITAALALAQLARLDLYLEWQKRNASVLQTRLAGVPHLVCPLEPDGHEHSWNHYILRLDDDVAWRGERVHRREIFVRALRAEGVPASVWQPSIAPEIPAFQLHNASGLGSLSNSQSSRRRTYDCRAFPVALRQCETHISLGGVLRYPHLVQTVERVAAAVAKVARNIEQLDDVG